VYNRAGRGSVLLICEHASNFIPSGYDGLGLDASDLLRHIAWDIGALGLAQNLARLLDAPLVHATYSRLLLDLNRPVDAADSIVRSSEDIAIPGNAAVSASECGYRRQRIYEPFHAELDALIDERLRCGVAAAVISIHSFTPRYHGIERPWHAGVISHADRELAEVLLQALSSEAALCIGDNLPYGPKDGVFHSLERHGQARGLRGAMIEVRNDLLADEAGQASWARRLAAAIAPTLAQAEPPG